MKSRTSWILAATVVLGIGASSALAATPLCQGSIYTPVGAQKIDLPASIYLADPGEIRVSDIVHSAIDDSRSVSVTVNQQSFWVGGLSLAQADHLVKRVADLNASGKKILFFTQMGSINSQKPQDMSAIDMALVSAPSRDMTCGMAQNFRLALHSCTTSEGRSGTLVDGSCEANGDSSAPANASVRANSGS
jgi:hypothetical protein